MSVRDRETERHSGNTKGGIQEGGEWASGERRGGR